MKFLIQSALTPHDFFLTYLGLFHSLDLLCFCLYLYLFHGPWHPYLDPSLFLFLFFDPLIYLVLFLSRVLFPCPFPYLESLCHAVGCDLWVYPFLFWRVFPLAVYLLDVLVHAVVWPFLYHNFWVACHFCHNEISRVLSILEEILTVIWKRTLTLMIEH